VGAITLPAITGVTQHCRDKKATEISGLIQERKTAAGARLRKTGRVRSGFATARLRHYTAALLLLIEGAYV